MFHRAAAEENSRVRLLSKFSIKKCTNYCIPESACLVVSSRRLRNTLTCWTPMEAEWAMRTVRACV